MAMVSAHACPQLGSVTVPSASKAPLTSRTPIPTAANPVSALNEPAHAPLLPSSTIPSSPPLSTVPLTLLFKGGS